MTETTDIPPGLRQALLDNLDQLPDAVKAEAKKHLPEPPVWERWATAHLSKSVRLPNGLVACEDHRNRERTLTFIREYGKRCYEAGVQAGQGGARVEVKDRVLLVNGEAVYYFPSNEIASVERNLKAAISNTPAPCDCGELRKAVRDAIDMHHVNGDGDFVLVDPNFLTALKKRTELFARIKELLAK